MIIGVRKSIMVLFTVFLILSGCSKDASSETTLKELKSGYDKVSTRHFGPQDSTKLEAGAELIDDEFSPHKMVVKVPLDSHSWAAQWSLATVSFRDIDYLIRIRARADKLSPKGTAFSCGIFSIANKTSLLKQIIDSSEISETDYKWLDCGNINGSLISSAYFYIGQLSPSAIKNLYVSDVEFIPETAASYKAKVRKPPMHLSDVPAQVNVGDVVELKVDTVKQLLYPAQKLLDDNSEVLSVSPATDYWSTKWHIFNHLAPGKYSVRALIKLTGAREGRGVRFGIYSPKIKKALFDREIPVTQIPVSDTYQWLNLGLANIINDNSSYMFVCSLGDNSFDSFLIKTIEFTRIE